MTSWSSSQRLRSRVIASISSRQTRSMAGASLSRASSVILAIAHPSAPRAAGSLASSTGSWPFFFSTRKNSVWIAWNRLPRVSGSRYCSGAGSSSGARR